MGIWPTIWIHWPASGSWRRRPARSGSPSPSRRPAAPDGRPVPRQRVSPLALCAVGALAAMAVVLVIGATCQLTAVTRSISDLQEQVSRLEDQRVSLVMDYERTFDMAEDQGGRRGGGHEEAHRRTGGIRGETGGGSKAEVYQAESDSLLSRLTRGVKNGARRSGGIFPLSEAI